MPCYGAIVRFLHHGHDHWRRRGSDRIILPLETVPSRLCIVYKPQEKDYRVVCALRNNEIAVHFAGKLDAS